LNKICIKSKKYILTVQLLEKRLLLSST